jgi:hypothetical protein
MYNSRVRLGGIALSVPLLVGAFAFGVMQYLTGWDATAFGPGYEVAAVMRSLVTKAEFADPYLQPTGPTAHVAPVYVAILALIFSILPEPGAVLAAVVVSSACLALTFAILPAELRRNRARLAQHPSYNRAEAQLVAEMGETLYGRQKLSLAAAWISDHPAQFARLCLRRVFHYWWPSLDEGWQAAATCALTPLGILGWWRRRHCRHSAALALCLLLTSLPFVVVQTDNRYRYPTLWANALLAGALFGPLRDRAPGPAD